jgi:hypothetical protein
MHFYIGLAWVSIIMKEKGGLRAHSTARPRSLPTKVLLEDENKETKRNAKKKSSQVDRSNSKANKR